MADDIRMSSDPRDVIPREFDLNNPPRQPYTHQDYPKVMYGPKGEVKVVTDAADEKRHPKLGPKPYAAFDYSRVSNGKAALKEAAPDAEADEIPDDVPEPEPEKKGKKGGKWVPELVK